MENNNLDFQVLGRNVKRIMYEYVKVKSFTNTVNEREVEEFFLNEVGNCKYFIDNPQHFGAYKIEKDPLDRSVCWAMVKGQGRNTVVLIHHYDIVDVEDFKGLKEWAFSPEELREKLLENSGVLPDDGKKDLESGAFIFGRGGADMKGGGAIQIALLEEYSNIKDFQGNVIVIAVPDEENLSAGMRGAVKLLAKLKKKHDLEFHMMINSEPHQRKNFDVGVLSEGSVGKMMPFVYVRGFLSHAGKVFEGFNPAALMARIVEKTEANMDLADIIGEECAPPPTWLYIKDSKEHYDVSMPLYNIGCLSVLTLNKSPKELLKKIKEISGEAFQETIENLNENYARFLEATGRDVERLPWESKVVNFQELYKEAENCYGEKFISSYENAYKQLLEKAKNSEISMIDFNTALINKIYEFIDDMSPRVVYGLLPPYYPNVSNLFLGEPKDKIRNISEKINEYTVRNFNQSYRKEYFYTGISDLSYINLPKENNMEKHFYQAMPLFGEYYNIPFAEIEEISMAGINIGPWGKDFHKISERINEEDLCERTPKILDFAINLLLD